MTAYVVYDVDIHDLALYQEYMAEVKPAIEAIGGRYLARGGEHKVIEGDWEPNRMVLLEFPSMDAALSFYECEPYQRTKEIRMKSSTARIILVEGI